MHVHIHTHNYLRTYLQTVPTLHTDAKLHPNIAETNDQQMHKICTERGRARESTRETATGGENKRNKKVRRWDV